MQETDKSKLGLVVEGGGVRAIYAAGVLDVLHDLHLPFSGVIGVSAGAIHGISFVSGQKGRSYRIYTRFCKDPRFFSFRTMTFAAGKSRRNSNRLIRKRLKLPAWSSGQ